MLDIHNAGFFPVSAIALPMGIFYGGIAQVIAGIMESKQGNTFGTTAFTSFGLFWLTLVDRWVIPGMNAPNGDATPAACMGWYLFMWGLFTFFLWSGTFGKNRALQFVFLSLVILFWLLAIRDWTGSAAIGKVAGYEGIVCGISAIYLAMAEVLNASCGREFLPIGGPGNPDETASTPPVRPTGLIGV